MVPVERERRGDCYDDAVLDDFEADLEADLEADREASLNADLEAGRRGDPGREGRTGPRAARIALGLAVLAAERLRDNASARATGWLRDRTSTARDQASTARDRVSTARDRVSTALAESRGEAGAFLGDGLAWARTQVDRTGTDAR